MVISIQKTYVCTKNSELPQLSLDMSPSRVEVQHVSQYIQHHLLLRHGLPPVHDEKTVRCEKNQSH